MKCVTCGKAKMVHQVRDLTYTYKGETTSIHNVGGFYCSTCGESVHNEEESQYLSSEMLAFNKEVNSASVDPEFIIATRKKLKLDQKEAAEIFGGGVNAFSRYENGKTKPPVALVHLLTILNNHPELLKEITEKSKKYDDTPDSKTRLKRRPFA